ncbi:MAG: zf-HC2 domain-containing protein [Acidimicrobiales bacterium]
MDCSLIREALSAALDDEDTGIAGTAVDAHVDTCPACRAWAADVGAVHRATRVRAAEPVPDLTAAILAAAPTARPSAGLEHAPPAVRRSPLAQPVSTWRWALLVVALTQLVLAAPAVLAGDGGSASEHAARELGSFDVALAVGLLVAAWQPARAWGLLPLAGALSLVLGTTAVVDLVDGSASTVGEAHHLLDLAGVAFLWLVAREARASKPTRTGSARWSAA